MSGADVLPILIAAPLVAVVWAAMAVFVVAAVSAAKDMWDGR